MKFFLVALFLVPSFFSFAEQNSDTPPAADPSRPTLTTPAHIPPAGYLQFEQGVLVVAGGQDFDTQVMMQQSLRLALARRFLVQSTSVPYARSTFYGTGSNDTGDVTLTAQGLLTDYNNGHAGKPTIALAYGHRVHSGTSPDYDNGSARQTLFLSGSGDVSHLFHYDTNILFNEVQQQGVRRVQFGQTLAISRNLTPSLSLTGEIWHFTQPFQHAHAVGTLWAAAYTVRPNLVVDAGFNRGLTTNSANWYGFAGFTYLLPHRLWPARP